MEEYLVEEPFDSAPHCKKHMDCYATNDDCEMLFVINLGDSNQRQMLLLFPDEFEVIRLNFQMLLPLRSGLTEPLAMEYTMRHLDSVRDSIADAKRFLGYRRRELEVRLKNAMDVARLGPS